MGRHVRKLVERMQAYEPGFQPKVESYIKLNTNENPYPPSPKVIEAIRGELGRLARYPDPLADAMRAEAAKLFNVKIENVIAGNGSDDLLNVAVRVFADPGQTVSFPSPTYSLYEVLTEMQGAVNRPMEYPEDWSLPEELFGNDSPLTFVANPNAPSGTAMPVGEIERLAKSLKGVLVVDEAYADFARENCAGLARKLDNVIVMRTLSKSYSLAGLRLGYAVASAELIEGMMKVKDSYNLDRVAIAAGAAALADQAHMKANAERIKATRERLTRELGAMGFTTLPSEANFVLTRPPKPMTGKKYFEKLWEKLILVRWFDRSRVSDSARISVGSDSEMDKLLEATREILKGK